MQVTKLSFIEYCVHLAWALLLGFGLWVSLPVLLTSAWTNDPSNRYGEYCFGLWLLASVTHWALFPKTWPFSLVLWVLFGSFCLLLGVVGELMALNYIGLACVSLAPIRSAVTRVLMFFPALVWMPVWVWLLSPYFGRNIALISLVIALVVTIISIAQRITCRK